jgi:hypothetical protein
MQHMKVGAAQQVAADGLYWLLSLLLRGRQAACVELQAQLQALVAYLSAVPADI